MLENMRRQGASIFVYLIFCLLIAIFIINFGPSGGKTQGGCSGDSNPILTVDGHTLSQSAFHVAYSNRFNRGQGKQKVYEALETLIRREILAQAAVARGLKVGDDLVQNEIKQGHFFLGGQEGPIPGIFDQDGIWNLNAFKGWVNELNVTINAYEDEQKRSMLAAMEADLLLGSVQVSRDEALQQYLYENNTVTYDVVAFKPEAYKSAMKLTDADVNRFLTTHADDVKARYKADERTYKGVKPQLHLREIFIAKAEPASKPADDKSAPKAADGKSKAADDKSKTADGKSKPSDKKTETAQTEPPAGMPIEQAKAKLEQARAAIAANKEKFADAARELSTDPAAKADGGDLGWHTADTPLLADKALDDAAKKLKAGEMTPVITTDRGAYLILAEGQRQGDLSYDQVKYEIAKDLARDVWSKEAAKRAAIAALESAKSGLNISLEQLYPRAKPAAPTMDLQKIMNDPTMSPEEKNQLIQQILRANQATHGGTGMLEVESKNQLASWNEEDVAAAGAAGSAKAGSAQAGSASAPATAAGGTTVATDAALEPSHDQLPEFANVAKPQLDRFGPTPRTQAMEGLGESKAAATALFDQLKPGEKAKQVYEADGNYILLQLVAHDTPDTKAFDKDAGQQIAELRQTRAMAFLEQWMKDKCIALAKDGKILPNLELVTDHDDQGRPLPIAYRPCMSFR